MASTSTSSVQKSFKYDVFLSFRGEDTRKGFVDHLYHALYKIGVITYKDDERIEKGERINEQLIRSIEESRFYIIVFSKNYASSSWCLDELVKIMECQKMAEHTAYPIFYDVEPTEVRHQSGAVGEAIVKLVENRKRKRSSEDVDREKEEDVGRWRNALKDAAGLAGWELKNTFDGHEAKFIEKIIKEISPKLHNFISLNIDDNLVGMETRLLNVVSSLKLVSDDVFMIGIWGIGGGGKTTLARAIFDHISIRFETKSFVENVREGSKGSGMKDLQKQVLQDVLNDQQIDVKSVHDGKIMMKRMMPSRKALVVLDDVDDIDQLRALAGELTWFKPGSTIIITTRDQQVLVAHGVNIIHDVNLLSDEEAICLFSRYAFKCDIPNQGYEELSRKVICYAAGLPLTIKVLGSHLCGRTEPEWVDAIERLKNIPLKETLEKLELSYNGLEKDQKEIFLDVVCILKGATKDRAIRTLESCGFNAHIGLKVLEQKSLVTISNTNGLGFHDHIEEMGRNIVRRSHPNEPSRHSRLWIKEEISDILVNESGTKATRSIYLYFNNVDEATILKGLRKMEELRLLYVIFPSRNFKDDEVNQYLPDTLQSLVWHAYPFRSLPEMFQANKLVNLEMHNSNIRELWEGVERKVLNKLRFLDLSYSKLRTFDLRATPRLEVLNLEGCSDFEELQFPVECLNLKVLNLSYSKVNNINLGPAPHLERLYLRRCYKLQELHAPVGCLEKLVDFQLDNCLNFPYFKVEIVHESANPYYVATFKIDVAYVEVCPVHPKINLPRFWFECRYDEPRFSRSGNFEKLISFGPCVCKNREYILATICDLQHLRELTLRGGIPQDLWLLQSLEKLHLYSQQFQGLPDSICMLKHLKSLALYTCYPLEQLPVNIWELGSLEEICIMECVSLRDIPDSICKMKCLKRLELSSCHSIMKLPEELGSLECLKVLNIQGTGISGLPWSIYQLKGLCIYGSREQLESNGFTSIMEDSCYKYGYEYVEL